MSMAPRFEAGDPNRPKGHALLYFADADRANAVLATYVVVLPVTFSPAKYMPPAFAAGMQQTVPAVAATALPPIPEPVESLAYVRRLAEFRGDDLLDGGVVGDGQHPERLMLAANQVSQEYAELYQEALDRAGSPAAAPEPPPPLEAPDEDTLRWMFLGERERIGELAKLTGQLRYAADGNDQRLLRRTVEQMGKLGKLLPEKFRIGEFLQAAQRPGEAGRRLAELYVERCYKLSNEQYEDLSRIDQEIEALERRG